MNCLDFSFSGYATLLSTVLDGEKYTCCDCVSLNPQRLFVLTPQTNWCWLRGCWHLYVLLCPLGHPEVIFYYWPVGEFLVTVNLGRENKICYLFFFLVWLYVPEKAPRIISEERSCVGVSPLITSSFCFSDMEVDLWTDSISEKCYLNFSHNTIKQWIG